jgi:hypothetical protein
MSRCELAWLDATAQARLVAGGAVTRAARPRREDLLLRVAARIEQPAPWSAGRPRVHA